MSHKEDFHAALDDWDRVKDKLTSICLSIPKEERDTEVSELIHAVIHDGNKLSCSADIERAQDRPTCHARYQLYVYYLMAKYITGEI